MENPVLLLETKEPMVKLLVVPFPDSGFQAREGARFSPLVVFIFKTEPPKYPCRNRKIYQAKNI